ncbi:MAG TPA: lipoyl(octanoyl) transferase LipB, partial [Chitinophagales bacterium]|nr:lipoyl(octanoyl) transferase LipB [Chitinophagales bacterium]
MILLDEGLKSYQEVLARQEELFNKNIALKLKGEPTTNYLILCEHPPVYTLGKSGKRENILVSDEDMNAEFYHVQRGGDVTFHGPGQMVAYPILDLDSLGIGVNQYIQQLEETIIQSLKEYGVTGERIEGAAGIWIKGKPAPGLPAAWAQDKKICAIGARVSRMVTMHGLAINISTDLSYFTKIMACGL